MGITIKGVTDPAKLTKAEILAMKDDVHCQWGADAILMINGNFELVCTATEVALAGEDGHGAMRHYTGEAEGYEVIVTLEQCEGEGYYVSVDVAAENGSSGFGSM